MRFLMLKAILFMFFVSVAYAAEPIAIYTPDGKSNMSVANVGDGSTLDVEIKGLKGKKINPEIAKTSKYIYYKMEDEIKDKISPDAYVVVKIYVPDGLFFRSELENNTENSGMCVKSDEINVFGTGEWVDTITHLKDFKSFRGLNYGMDMRFSTLPEIVFGNVYIYNEYPADLNIPSSKERLQKLADENPDFVPTDMSYVFGNNATENGALLYKILGVNAIDSYSTWQTVEPLAEGEWDFSQWENQVNILREAGLKWVPLLCTGPAYANPNWFRETKDHFPCVCLEHGTPNKIESLWNPNFNKWSERYVAEFAKRFKEEDFDSIKLGIQGDYGEAIYSASGGGWTFDVPGEYHQHIGYWCNDPYALADFKNYMKKKYNNIQKLNRAWHKEYSSFDDLIFPFYGEDEKLKFMENIAFNSKNRRFFLDFIEWYRNSMTDLSDWWFKLVRSYFPNTKIYLSTGGFSIPELGCQFFDQCKVAAKSNAGVRITNEGSDYAKNFAYTRIVASASKHYGSYFSYEPAGEENFYGIPARIYNATASGASQFHDYDLNITGSAETIKQQREHYKYLFKTNPVVPIAVFYPDTSLTVKWNGDYLDVIIPEMRDYFDCDLLDESLILSGALEHNKIFIIADGSVMEPSVARKIAAWARKGGIVYVTNVNRFECVEGTNEPETILFPKGKKGTKMGTGSIFRVNSMSDLAKEVRINMEKLGYGVYDIVQDGVYVTEIEPKRFLIYSKNDSEKEIQIKYKGKSYKVFAKAQSITDFKIN